MGKRAEGAAARQGRIWCHLRPSATATTKLSSHRCPAYRSPQSVTASGSEALTSDASGDEPETLAGGAATAASPAGRK
jgi:hypothetical protein